MAINRSNADAFNDAEKYSAFVVKTLPDIMLPDNMYRDVTSELSDGNTLNIPTTGAVSIQEVAEGVPLNFSAIDSGQITMQITEYIGDAWYVSDEVRQDYARISLLESARAEESVRALAEYKESKFLAALNTAQTDAATNPVNGVGHRFASAETGGVVTIDHLRRMKYAMDKARVPQAGRIFLVDPSVEYTLNGIAQVVTSDNPMFEGIITEGFAQSHKFVKNIFGFDIWTTDFLPKGTFSDGTTSIATTGVVNSAFSVVSDQHVPIMYAERKAPSVEGWRDNEERREKFQTTYRAGWGAQRVDTLYNLITDSNV